MGGPFPRADRLGRARPEVFAEPPLDPAKFRDPLVTAQGEARAWVSLKRLRTLWFNADTLCNLTCAKYYIESSPKSDRLAYLSAAEVGAFLDEIERDRLGTEETGFTGGEPCMNPLLSGSSKRHSTST
jgi:uncharacterized Fe-S cluster-containing radical SAM superfamily protein